MSDLRPRGAYGFDAPYVPIVLAIVGLLFLAVTLLSTLTGGALVGWVITLIIGLAFLALAAWYVYVTRRGKFAVWARVLRSLRLHGDERLLDLGCGRGAVLLQAAKLLPRGRAVGIDLWKTSDQSGNALSATERNAELEGVRDRVDLGTGDMTNLPYEDASFDVIVSSIAIHNIKNAGDRAKAVEEAARVLRPGGTLTVADIRATSEYASTLRGLGWAEVTRRSLGPGMWFGLFSGTSLVRGTKPAAR
ncbi:MAG: class I SAM-dependent methyltransferase [Candidatus Dormibacteraceae bacterium]